MNEYIHIRMRAWLLFSIVVLLAACAKDPGSYPRLDQHLQWCVDSCIVQAPNVFTPDGDGIDDVFFVWTKNTSTCTWDMKDADGVVVFSATTSNQAWSGRANNSSTAPLIPGRYTYTISVTSTSGQTLTTSRYIHLVPDHFTTCFDTGREPVFGDQFDPRICGPAYESNDRICPFI